MLLLIASIFVFVLAKVSGMVHGGTLLLPHALEVLFCLREKLAAESTHPGFCFPKPELLKSSHPGGQGREELPGIPDKSHDCSEMQVSTVYEEGLSLVGDSQEFQVSWPKKPASSGTLGLE